MGNVLDEHISIENVGLSGCISAEMSKKFSHEKIYIQIHIFNVYSRIKLANLEHLTIAINI